MTVMLCQCGATHAPHVAHIRYTDDVQAWQVHCLRCRMSGPLMPAEADAIRAWNRLDMAARIAEAAWLEREADDPQTLARWGLWLCVRDELRRLLDQWGEDPDA